MRVLLAFCSGSSRDSEYTAQASSSLVREATVLMALSTQKVHIVSTGLETMAWKIDAPSCFTSQSAIAKKKEASAEASRGGSLERETH